MLERVVLICTLAIFTGCGHPSDSRLTGEWTISGKPDTRIIYRSDHTFEAILPTVVGAVFHPTGTWRIEGNQIVVAPENGEDRNGEDRQTIVLLTDRALETKTQKGAVIRCERLK